MVRYSGSGWASTPVTRGSSGDDPDELDGVHAGRRRRFAADERPARRPGELQQEGVDVRGGPVGDHVGHQSAVVLGGQLQGGAGGAGDVHPVHPHVAGEDEVDEVGDGAAAERLAERDGYGADGGGQGRPQPDGGLGPARHPLDQLCGRQRPSLADLHLVHAVDQLGRADLPLDAGPSRPTGGRTRAGTRRPRSHRRCARRRPSPSSGCSRCGVPSRPAPGSRSMSRNRWYSTRAQAGGLGASDRRDVLDGDADHGGHLTRPRPWRPG